VTLRPVLQANLKQVQEDLNPLRCLELLQKIPNDDCELLLMDGELGRPERMILTHLLVPPIPIRPSVGMQSGQRYRYMGEMLWPIICSTEELTICTIHRWGLRLQGCITISAIVPQVSVHWNSIVCTPRPFGAACACLIWLIRRLGGADWILWRTGWMLFGLLARTRVYWLVHAYEEGRGVRGGGLGPGFDCVAQRCSNEDDLTVKIGDMVFINNEIRHILDTGLKHFSGIQVSPAINP
jgi:hypothetical protein